jgi:hypothetical protein
METNWTPTTKVTAGAAGGAISTLIMVFLPSFGIEMPAAPGTEAALGVLATLLCSYWVKESV